MEIGTRLGNHAAGKGVLRVMQQRAASLLAKFRGAF
jgi:hypothetical protein